MRPGVLETSGRQAKLQQPSEVMILRHSGILEHSEVNVRRRADVGRSRAVERQARIVDLIRIPKPAHAPIGARLRMSSAEQYPPRWKCSQRVTILEVGAQRGARNSAQSSHCGCDGSGSTGVQV